MVAQRLKCLPAMRETWVQSLGWEDPLEKEMATHSSILAWRIPWTEEPGGLQSTGSQRVGHDWALSLHFTFKEKASLPWQMRTTITQGSFVYSILLPCLSVNLCNCVYRMSPWLPSHLNAWKVFLSFLGMHLSTQADCSLCFTPFPHVSLYL